MFKVIQKSRRGPILRHPVLPCLAPYHTLNLTSGCPNRCVYCYAQSYGHHPGWGTVVFYSNTFELLFKELPRKRIKPVMVYFSTASEPFLPVPVILEQMYSIMRLLLKNDISILISSKCHVPDNFIELFSSFPGLVHIQVGLTTTYDEIRDILEPRALNVEGRLDNLARLVKAGVSAEARMDPLFPGLTDTLDSIMDLMDALEKIHVKRAAASFLFMRYGLDPVKRLNFNGWNFMDMAKKIYTHKVTNYCGHGVIWIPDTDYRRKKYALLQDTGTAHGIDVHLCHCKNSDITDDCCHPLPEAREDKQMSFI
jgi:DNA repair photolyase